MARSFDIKSINNRFFKLFGKKTRSELSALLRVSQASLSEWANGKKQVPWDKLALAKELSGKSWDWLLGSSTDDNADVETLPADTLTIADSMPRSNATLPVNIDEPKLVQRFRSPGSAAAIAAYDGRQGGFPDSEPGVWDEIVIPETTHFIQVRGDSMKPIVLDGQYVIVGPEYMPGYTYPGRRDIVVVQVQIVDERRSGAESIWEGVYCKRVQDGGDTWQFTSINPTGESFTVLKANCRMWPVLGIWFAGKGRPPEED